MVGVILETFHKTRRLDLGCREIWHLKSVSWNQSLTYRCRGCCLLFFGHVDDRICFESYTTTVRMTTAQRRRSTISRFFRQPKMTKKREAARLTKTHTYVHDTTPRRKIALQSSSQVVLLTMAIRRSLGLYCITSTPLFQPRIVVIYFCSL